MRGGERQVVRPYVLRQLVLQVLPAVRDYLRASLESQVRRPLRPVLRQKYVPALGAVVWSRQSIQ